VVDALLPIPSAPPGLQARRTAALRGSAQLGELREAADALMLRRAHAFSILRWRGHPTTRLAELPADEA